MNPQTRELKNEMNSEFEAGKKAFHEAMAKAQSQIDTATVEINKLRGELKTQTAEVKAKTVARVDELTKTVDSARKDQQAKIEAHLNEMRMHLDKVNAGLKQANAERKAAGETTAKAIREEYEAARKALTVTLDAEVAEARARIEAVKEAAVEKKAAAKASIQAKIADLHTKHEVAQKKLHDLKQADTAAFGEMQHGVRTAISEVKTAVQHARADIAAA